MAEHTGAVLSSLPADVLLARGDLIVISVSDHYGLPYLLASFRGEENGRAAFAVIDAIHSLLASLPAHRIIFGMDADTRAITSRQVSPPSHPTGV